MRWKMSVCAYFASFLLHDSSFDSGFCISTAAGSRVVTWIWIVTCCDLVRLGLGGSAGVRHFDSDYPWNISCVVDCAIERQTACAMKKTATELVFACLGTGFARMSNDDASVWAPQRESADGLVGNCSLHVWVIEIASGCRGAIDVCYHLG